MAILVVSVIGKMHSEIPDLHTPLPGTVLSLYLLLLLQNRFIIVRVTRPQLNLHHVIYTIT